jgi:glycine/D-amino acid oxidase-like deaminating enzyme
VHTLPLSHCSSGVFTPSPHTVSQTLRHPSEREDAEEEETRMPMELEEEVGALEEERSHGQYWYPAGGMLDPDVPPYGVW